ncbi:MEDS: MEthanogen/methylotroph, DcmR Sensory domain [Streptomyces sp. DconLS]|nr:MEDS: MEthanogen/methylotroph, DcmR Sensory domain [Streptomyces sp. DconLS]
MSGESFAHPALFYGGPRAYLDGTVPFVRAAPAAGEPVAVAVPGEKLALIRDALGAEREEVRFLDMREAGRNPGRIIPGVLCAFADAQPPCLRTRIIGEPVWAGRDRAEYPACVQHEALINAAFRGRQVTILCPYDTAALHPRALADARTTHPVVIEGAEQRPGAAYDPEGAVARHNLPLPPAPPPAPGCSMPGWTPYGCPPYGTWPRTTARGSGSPVRRWRISRWSPRSWPPTAWCTAAAAAR